MTRTRRSKNPDLQDDLIDTAAAYIDLGVDRGGEKLSDSKVVAPLLRALERLFLEGKTAPKGVPGTRPAREGDPKSDTIFPILDLSF
jgi:hypothetical protein